MFSKIVLVACLQISFSISTKNNEIFTVANKRCITNGSAALAIIHKIGNSEDENIKVSSFFPTQENGGQISCNRKAFNGNTEYLCSSWNPMKALDGPITQYITDRRWEAFPAIKSENLTEHVLKMNNFKNFVVPFSVRTSRDAHIFLCDGQSPYDSNCYWIMLGSHKGTRYGLRKCKSREIPEDIHSFPDSNCFDIIHGQKVENVTHFDENIWMHFKINRSDNLFRVSRGEENLVEYKDIEIDNFETKNIFIQSRGVKGLWKIHEYNYLFIDTPNDRSTEFGPPIQITKAETCISMFVVTCKTCKLTIKFKLASGNYQKLKEEFINTEDEMWEERKIFIETKNFIGKTMQIYEYWEYTNDSFVKPFWAIDEMKLCEREEYRYIKSKSDNFTCQKIEIENKNILRVNKNEDISKQGIDCPESTFGKFCIPCKMFNNVPNCGNFVFCDIDISKKKECHCTSGAEGPQCSKECRVGTYGHGCQKNCSIHCSKKCLRFNGFCLSPQYPCKDSYEGSRCDTPPEILFVTPPEAFNVEETSCIIKVKDFTVEYPETKEKPENYAIQYALLSEDDNITESDSQILQWKTVETNLRFNETISEIVVDNLQSDSYYLVRAVVNPNYGRSLNGPKSYLKTNRFKTKCVDLSEDDITINTTSISATLDIKWPQNSCKLSRYELALNGSVLGKLEKNFVLRNNIKPFENYIIKIRNSVTKKIIVKEFRTKEGVPSAVRNIKIVEKFAEQLKISWSEPQSKRGIIIHYRVNYMNLGRVESRCYRIEDSHNITTKVPSITLTDLIAYSKYRIQIRAVTNGGEGESVEEITETAALEYLTDKERFELETFEATSNSVEIKVSNISCDDLRGPIYTLLKAKCKNEWCPNNKRIQKVEKLFLSSSQLRLQNLRAFSNYTVTVDISRDNSSWENVGDIEFQTKPTVPNVISHLEAYSKDATSISLRWKAPYPPTGDLEQYRIEYTYSGYPYYIYVKPLLCELWKDYHCAILTALSSNLLYYIKISARNKVPPNVFGQYSSSIYVSTRVEDPEPPYGLSLKWEQNNDLLVSWYHPNVTNGRLTYFLLEIKEHQVRKTNKLLEISYVLKSENDYRLRYEFKILHDKFKACTIYDVSVQSVNIKYMSTLASSSTTSPPNATPSIQNKDITTEITNHTITIHIPKRNTKSITAFYETIHVVVSKADATEDLNNFEDSLSQGVQNFTLNTSSTIVYTFTNWHSLVDLQIGNENISSHDVGLANGPLEAGTNYSLTFFLVGECFGMVRVSRFQRYVSTLGESQGNLAAYDDDDDGSGVLWALLLLLLVPLVGLGYWYRKRMNDGKDFLIHPQQDEIPLPRLPYSTATVRTVKRKKSQSDVLPPFCTTHSMPIRIINFEKYVKEALATGELERQHNLFPRGLIKPCECGSRQENKSKNRYKNLIAYDDTRVKLQKIDGDQYSDYINANYIDGYKRQKCYIATQGPKNTTMTDFWRMIWQENVRNIIMLANIYENGKKKVEKYWPEINEEKVFDKIRIQHVSTDVFANHDVRVFKVWCNNQARTINQLHFTTWPDHGVPLYPQSLVPLLQKLLKIPYDSQSPIVVHCSAGVGRTGTIILSDICLRMAAGEGAIDLLAHLENIRSQRANLVDNVEQYKLAHLVIVECLFGMRTSINCTEDMKEIVERTLRNDGAEIQMKYIADTQWQDSAMETMLENERLLFNYPEKNRFRDIFPEHYRLFLTCYPIEDESSSYINAVLVDGFRNPGRYIVTQQPMPNTIGDFWRMVLERSCTVVISLNNLNLDDKTVCRFWPTSGEEMEVVDYITLTHVKTKRLDCYSVITVQVHVNLSTFDNFQVDIIEMSYWEPRQLLPDSTEEFLAFLDAAEALSRNSEHVIVTCYDGATASGLYVAMSFLIEKMKLEHECDVCLAVRSVRHSRKQFIATKEQYEFLYRTAVTYISGFQSYANFT